MTLQFLSRILATPNSQAAINKFDETGAHPITVIFCPSKERVHHHRKRRIDTGASRSWMRLKPGHESLMLHAVAGLLTAVPEAASCAARAIAHGRWQIRFGSIPIDGVCGFLIAAMAIVQSGIVSAAPFYLVFLAPFIFFSSAPLVRYGACRHAMPTVLLHLQELMSKHSDTTKIPVFSPSQLGRNSG